MDDALAVLCKQVRDATTLSVEIGHPRELNTQLVLWPWHMTSDRLPRNRQPSDHTSKQNHPMSLSLLLLSQSGLDGLIQAVHHLAQNPVLIMDDKRYMVKEQNLTQEFQVALLEAADIQIQPAMSYLLVG